MFFYFLFYSSDEHVLYTELCKENRRFKIERISNICLTELLASRLKASK